MELEFVIQIVSLVFSCLPLAVHACHRKPGVIERFTFYYSESTDSYHVKTSPIIDIMYMPTTGCININSTTSWVKSGLKSNSIENGECITPFRERDCQGSKLEAPAPSAIYYPINSFRLCWWELYASFSAPPKYPSNNPVFVLYKDPAYSGTKLGEYSGQEGCKNLATSQAMVSSVETHGHCLHLFEDKDCQGKMLKLHLATKTPNYNLHNAGWANQATSIRACGVVLQGRITMFRVSSNLEDLERNDDLHSIHLSDPEYLDNNGSAPTQMPYEREIFLTETFLFEKIDSFNSLHSIEFLDSIDIEGPLCFPSGSTAGCEPLEKLRNVLKDVYKFNRQNKSHQMTRKMSVERSRDFSIRKKLKVQACSTLEVSSFIQARKETPIKFHLGVRISGENRGYPMTAKELRSKLPPGMDYLGDLTGYEIFAKTSGTILATVGVKPLVHVKRLNGTIFGCNISHQQQTAPSTTSDLTVAQTLEKHQAYLIPLGILAICAVCIALCVRISQDEGLREKEIELVTIGRYALTIEFHQPCHNR